VLLEGCVEVGDVGLVVFFVVEVHGLFVYVGFESVVGVWQWRQFVSHFFSPLLALRYPLTLPG
jgi:hypothetical protein